MSNNRVLGSIITVDHNNNNIRAVSPKNFETKHLAEIADLIDTAVTVFEEKLNQHPQGDGLQIDEVNLTFGVDFQSNMGLTIVSIFQTQVDAGATFQVSIKLSHKS